MTDTPLHKQSFSRAMERSTTYQRWARRLVHRILAQLDRGELVLHEPGTTLRFGRPGEGGRRVSVRIQDFAAYPDILLRGSNGAAESFMRGDWTSESLVDVIHLLCDNTRFLERWQTGPGRVVEPLLRLFHTLRRNTKGGSRRNIAAHYDLSNEFFSLFLDETMSYSAGLFETPGSTLREASEAKLERICRRLELSPDDHVLEIGTGWGGFAIHAARNFGCRVTTTTISAEQHEWARRRIDELGLGDRITLLQDDYRDLRGQYDKLVSIEMIEAVGYEYYDRFFEICSHRLKPDGAMLLQAIVIRDDLFERARKTVDFIKRHVFPGTCIPSRASIADSISRVTDLRLVDTKDLTTDYARTLACWRERFLANQPAAHALGFDERFLRMWEFYLSYCEGGFSQGRIGDVQLMFAKPQWAGRNIAVLDESERRLTRGAA